MKIEIFLIRTNYTRWGVSWEPVYKWKVFMQYL